MTWTHPRKVAPYNRKRYTPQGRRSAQTWAYPRTAAPNDKNTPPPPPSPQTKTASASSVASATASDDARAPGQAHRRHGMGGARSGSAASQRRLWPVGTEPRGPQKGLRPRTQPPGLQKSRRLHAQLQQAAVPVGCLWALGPACAPPDLGGRRRARAWATYSDQARARRRRQVKPAWARGLGTNSSGTSGQAWNLGTKAAVSVCSS